MNSIDEKPKKEVLNFAKKGDFGFSYSPFWGFSTKMLLL
jgi:hypothetical protein